MATGVSVDSRAEADGTIIAAPCHSHADLARRSLGCGLV